ncbi:MAG: diadenylate cyclase CdaA [candidate division Zixibacteria bacterium]|nr:diadenylate cyclase CdaA [candidate division Zixibacteria bacterium]
MGLFHIGFLKFGIIDLIDVAIVAFLFYRFLILVKGTRSIQILFGVFVLILFSFVAFWFQLEGLKWMISNIATVGIIVLVIVFQPELRKALAQFGHNKLFRLFIRYEKQKILDELIKGSIKLSELKYGALIVLEREIGLKNFIETGKSLNAQLSSEMLLTLFTPYTPLHDGAAIIRGETIVAAACTLPLTQKREYDTLFGMRHKAGIGITEDSDAISLIVSEETGEISIASNGFLIRGVEKEKLREILIKILEGNK